MVRLAAAPTDQGLILALGKPRLTIERETVSHGLDERVRRVVYRGEPWSPGLILKKRPRAGNDSGSETDLKRPDERDSISALSWLSS